MELLDDALRLRKHAALHREPEVPRLMQGAPRLMQGAPPSAPPSAHP
eukprot:CAMPEP_0179150176 /NCGR_PEP_ID=MMETSP0796-20121207/72813_1 /TAXON_ID=73915 /ORGANISM="Pyrodinium bahamense, Strain pbaha01" /LENGTH=46 /DNA_ID= /DNA_START= /DNA_END= /DNA_ORIENTATION=